MATIRRIDMSIHFSTLFTMFDLLMTYKWRFSYLHVYYILRNFPTYTVIRNCIFVKFWVIFLPTRYLGNAIIWHNRVNKFQESFGILFFISEQFSIFSKILTPVGGNTINTHISQGYGSMVKNR